jgi:YHS domain-containing protein/phosphohistidine phosphatase SixA
MKKIILVFITFLIITSVFAQKNTTDLTTIIFVRHAEKIENGTSNPNLTNAGVVRSVQLAYLLRDDSITAVFSTDYERTLQTAEPTANFHDQQIQKYLPSSTKALFQNISSNYEGKTILVVGHSNTVPSMVNYLCNANLPNIEHYQYNDLFIVTFSKIGQGKLLKLKYGQLSKKPIITNVDENNIGVKGYDLVSYFTDNESIKGNPYISTTHEGVTYYFSTQKHLELFTLNPERYLPQFGGYCTSNLSINVKEDIDPEIFKIIDKKLYLFKDKSTFKKWKKGKVKESLKLAIDNW